MKKCWRLDAKLVCLETGYHEDAGRSTDKELFFRVWLFNKFYTEISVGYRQK